MQLIKIALIGTLQEIIWIALRSIGPLREHTWPFLGLIFLEFILCLWAFFRLRINTKNALWLVLGFALIFRATLLFAPPYQSEDVYRYIWDAKVASKGISPYAYKPEATELEGLRDATVYPMINSKPYITAYPPVSQIIFRVSYTMFGDNATAMKAFFSLCEFLGLIIAWRLLVRWKKSLQPLFLMAWHPFFVFEFSASGHSDSSMILLILLAIYLLDCGKNNWALAFYAGAVLAKLHPALLFPFFFRRVKWTSTIVGLATGLGLTFLYFSFGSLMRYIFTLRLYFKLFEYNASIHYLIRFIGRIGFNAGWDKAIGPYLGAILLFIFILISLKFPARNAQDVLKAGFWLMTADLLLATTVHPWYISWAALALPLFPYAFMLYWTGACFLSYIGYSYHPVYEPAWALLLEYIPVYALLFWELLKRRSLLESWLEPREIGEENKDRC